MPVILLLVYLAIIGLIAWLLITYVPMPPGIRTVIVVAAVVICVLLLLQAIGVLGMVGSPTVPRIR